MHLWRTGVITLLTFIAAVSLFTCAASCQESIGVTNMTIEISETGALHYKIIQTMQGSRDGVTGSYLELQKQFKPENLSIYDYATGKPLKYNQKEFETAYAYDLIFDRPYYTGYTFVVEYDNHNRIIDEGKGIYSIGTRPGVDIRKIERIYTIILPEKNFTYLDYNHALDKPVSVEKSDGRTIVQFRNTSSAPADYAWEIKFRAVGIKDELRKPESGKQVPLPGMSAFLSIFVLIAVARLIRN
jgi:hypothetical protein